MRFSALPAVVAVALFQGCAGSSQPTEVGRDHPANPDAAAAPVGPASQTLATSSHAGHGSAATMAAGAMYACPMHPDVTSTDPEAKCPKCQMKINKPVTRPTTTSAPAPQHDHGGGGK